MKNIDFLMTNLIAHRGYHDMNKKIPENSLLAFKRAIRYGYIIELDIHLLRDGNIIVFHDNNLKRMCGVNKLIELCSYNEIKKLKLLDTDCNIPLLKDVLNLINGRVPILIETKFYPMTGKLEKKLMILLKRYKGLYAIHSFNPKSILWFKNNYPNVPRGLLVYDNNKNNNIKKFINITLIINIILKCDFISYPIKSLPNNFINIIKKTKPIIGWTVKNKKDYKFYKKYCNNLICENINSFK